jgi:predicted DNA-binding transcriptional regulator
MDCDIFLAGDRLGEEIYCFSAQDFREIFSISAANKPFEISEVLRGWTGLMRRERMGRGWMGFTLLGNSRPLSVCVASTAI